jgi:HNH endonuclease
MAREAQGQNTMMLELTQGYRTEIDFCDWWKVQGYRWFAHVRKNTVYAVASPKKGVTVYMHRQIKQPPEGKWTDHADGNGLNNRWDNLRIATPSQNNANAYRPANASGYIGVNATPAGRWQARARRDGVRYHIGVFDTAEEAARAYDEWTAMEYGRFAVLNFPVEDK